MAGPIDYDKEQQNKHMIDSYLWARRTMIRSNILIFLVFISCMTEPSRGEEHTLCAIQDEDEKKVCILATEGFDSNDLRGVVFSYIVFGDDLSKANDAKQKLESIGLNVRSEVSDGFGTLLLGISNKAHSISDLQIIRKELDSYSIENSGTYTGWRTENSLAILSKLEEEKIELKTDMQAMAEGALCYVDSDCIAEPVGKKGCGGPKGYAVVSKSLQQPGSRWSVSVNRIYEIDTKLNFLKYPISDCGYNTPPETLSCNHGRCEAVVPEQDWRNYVR